MTLSVNLSAELEQILRTRASAAGQAPEAYAEAVLARDLTRASGNGAARAGERPSVVEGRLATLAGWAGSVSVQSASVEDGRDGIYAGRGE